MALTGIPSFRKRVVWSALDSVLARTLVRPKQRSLLPSADVTSVLVIEPWSIGDIVMAMPFLAQLRAVFPQAQVTLLAGAHARALLAGTCLVDEIIETDLCWTVSDGRVHPSDYRWRELNRVWRELRRRDFDIAFKARMHLREHLIIALSGATRRVAYAFGSGDRVLTDAIPVQDANRHKVSDWLGLLAPFGGPAKVDVPPLKVGSDERRWASDFLRSRGFSEKERIVGLHPGASVPQKRWPLERFKQVAGALTSRSNVRVLAFVDPQGYGESLGEIESVVTAKVGLRELIALIERCDLLLCNDSGPMHIAGALGVSTVALFGSGVSVWFAPLGHGHRLISVEKIDDGAAARPYDVSHIPTARVLEEVEAALAQRRADAISAAPPGLLSQA